MKGLMQDDPLILTRFLERASTFHALQQIVTRAPGGTHRQSYEDLHERSRRLASALEGLGVGPGDRVGSFAWNSWRHLELYFAVPCMGAVLHTLNVRLHPDQVAWIANHAEDRVVFVDGSLLPAFERVAPALRSVEHLVVMGDPDGASPPKAQDYETLLAEASAGFEWPELDERSASTMCYTSGTTGRPKGVVYSHRAMVLHSFMENLAETIGLTSRDVVMPVVPMFHANGWGLPYAAAMVGAGQVFTGPSGGDPATVAEMIESERVTVAAGVPTVWMGLLQHLESNPRDLSSLRMIKAGGAPLPTTLIDEYERRFGVPLLQGWGMTETGPLAALSRLTPETEELPTAERSRLRAKQGRPVPGIRTRVVAEDGSEVPWDGKSMGEIRVRGNWVASSYFHDERTEGSVVDGWLRTGDVAVVDEFGFMQLVDRTKDLVKSGGEWISSIELENAIMGHPAVLEAAVIAVPHERWQERPLACVVLKPGARATGEELIDSISSLFPKWWLPDEVTFVEEIPKTSVGKFDKRALRMAFVPGPSAEDREP